MGLLPSARRPARVGAKGPAPPPRPWHDHPALIATGLAHTLRSGALASAVACAAIALAVAGTAAAGVSVGVNDDAGKDPSLLSWFYPTMGSEGLQGDTLTLRWDEGSPTTVPDQEAVSEAIATAKANGVTIELDLYPLHSQVF
ncbi:MAG TPA: hypothetical protein VEH82_12010, partial [Acidimicrobiales bacterium]|nr:hypothetical protein [Acidimicrobiales bacterium]